MGRSGVKQWLENDSLFTEELISSHPYAVRAGDLLQEEGLDVEVTALKVRDQSDMAEIRAANRREFSDEFDLLVNRCRVEVKSRRLAFTCVKDYPYPTIIIDTVYGFDKKTLPPLASVIVSRETNQAIVVGTWTKHLWTERRVFDRVRKIWDNNYEAPKIAAISLTEFASMF